MGEINRNSLRLDQIIESVKKLMKTEGQRRKPGKTVTPDKGQSKKLKDRVEKVIQEQHAAKYLK